MYETFIPLPLVLHSGRRSAELAHEIFIEQEALGEIQQVRIAVKLARDEKLLVAVRGGGRGDELVIVNVEIPSKLTKEQRELFEQLAATMGTTVKPKDKGFLDWLNEALGG